MPISYFEEHGYKIKEGYIPRLDYIKIVDALCSNIKEDL